VLGCDNHAVVRHIHCDRRAVCGALQRRQDGRLPSSLLHEKFVKACRSGRVHDVEQLVLSSPTAIEVNQPSNDRKTALFHAITARSLPLVRFLLKCGASVHKRSFVFFRLDCSAFNFESCDEPPLVTAARVASTDILRCLLQVPAVAAEHKHTLGLTDTHIKIEIRCSITKSSNLSTSLIY